MTVLFGGIFFVNESVQANSGFLTFLFLAILIYNSIFIVVWVYMFGGVLLTSHQNLLRRFPCLKCLRLTNYEEDLQMSKTKIMSKKKSRGITGNFDKKSNAA